MGHPQDQSQATGTDGEDDGPLSIPDERLPEDLRPSEDNPLAQPADDDVPDDAVVEGAGGGRSGTDSEDASVGDGDASDTSSVEAPSDARSDDPG